MLVPFKLRRDKLGERESDAVQDNVMRTRMYCQVLSGTAMQCRDNFCKFAGWPQNSGTVGQGSIWVSRFASRSK